MTELKNNVVDKFRYSVSIPKVNESFPLHFIKEPAKLTKKELLAEMHNAVNKFISGRHNMVAIKGELMGLISLFYVMTCDPLELPGIKIKRSTPTIIGPSQPINLSGEQKTLLAEMHEAVGELETSEDMGKTKSRIISLISMFYETTCNTQKLQSHGLINKKEATK